MRSPFGGPSRDLNAAIGICRNCDPDVFEVSALRKQIMGGISTRRAVHPCSIADAFFEARRDSKRQIDLQPTTERSDKAYSMSGFKEPGFADRQKAAQEARQNLLSKFRAQPAPDDPAVLQRRAEREAIAARREEARQAREAAQAEQRRLEEEAAAAEAIRMAREKEEEAERLAALEADQKAKRDARYAARKKKKK